MKKPYTVMTLVLFVIIISGCLGSGRDEGTTMPTESQVNRCLSEMYLNVSAKITPLGFKLESGMDDAIWFKFETDADDLSLVFDTTVVDTGKFEENFTFTYEMQGVGWWDVEGKNLLGGQVSLPNARFMNIGVEKIAEGYLIYIMWHET